jgi:hypothetical protein
MDQSGGSGGFSEKNADETPFSPSPATTSAAKTANNPTHRKGPIMIRVSMICFVFAACFVQLAGSAIACPPGGGGYYGRPVGYPGSQPTGYGYARVQPRFNHPGFVVRPNGALAPNPTFSAGAGQLQGGAIPGGAPFTPVAPKAVAPNSVAPNGAGTLAPALPSPPPAENPPAAGAAPAPAPAITAPAASPAGGNPATSAGLLLGGS